MYLCIIHAWFYCYHCPRGVAAASLGVAEGYLIWGFEYNFTNYKFKTNMISFKHILPESARGLVFEIKVVFEIVVG